MGLRVLIIDDQADSVAPLIDELTQSLPESSCIVVAFGAAEASLKSHDPHVVVLDLMQGTGADATPDGLATRAYIWGQKFCPLVIYTARPDAIEEGAAAGHPFFRVIQKGAASEKGVLETIRTFEPHIAALDDVSREIRWAMNGVLREIAPRVFERIPDEAERRVTLVRSARRRVAARMDEDLSTGEPGLKTWEFYLCPPVVDKHLLTGDILRQRDGDKNTASSYRVVLTPSCDLVQSGTRQPKVKQVLVATCCGVKKLLDELQLSGIAQWKDSQRKRLTSALNQGHSQSCLPLPELPGEFPSMVADLRDLQLLALTDIGPDKDWVRIASVDNPLRELTAWAYVGLAARPGLPDRDFDAWVSEMIAAEAKG